jgi:hypothetical protein
MVNFKVYDFKTRWYILNQICERKHPGELIFEKLAIHKIVNIKQANIW